jgi:phosphate/sulfate permease
MFSVPMTVHREQSMKTEDQQDATIRCLLLTTSVSTCFWHHYAHLQENIGPVTAFGVLFWFC